VGDLGDKSPYECRYEIYNVLIILKLKKQPSQKKQIKTNKNKKYT
jgi:hypothetical protein